MGADVDWAYRPMSEIYSEIVARFGVEESNALGVLEQLESAGLAERETPAGLETAWRATPAAVDVSRWPTPTGTRSATTSPWGK